MTAIDYSKTVHVELVPHCNKIILQTPLGPMEGEEHYEQYQVMVSRVDTPKQKRLVAYIGKQDGANFCPLPDLHRFPHSLQHYIADKAKEIHGKASPAPWTDIPPPLGDGSDS